MPNPILPFWEHIPDGEPRVFGDRVYLYGSHDKAYSRSFCDAKLKVWSAPISDPSHWVCHGDVFHSRADEDHAADEDWCQGELYAPDVIEKDGKYYLFAYLFYAHGCIGVSDTPYGPFRLQGKYRYDKSASLPKDFCNNGVFVDPGVLVDDDGKVYVYCGFEWSYVVRLDPDDLTRVLPETYQRDILPAGKPFDFFEACSPRKIGSTYYLIYSPRVGSRLAYATSDSPTGPFTYRGVIIDNGVDYPGGNDHGSICKLGEQWYIFYHRTSNNTIYSRQACVERIAILPDGSIPEVEMTSLGFDESLDPYEVTPANIACVLKGGCCVKQLDPMRHIIAGIAKGCVVGYKYFDFGKDDSGTRLTLLAAFRGTGEIGLARVMLDDPENGRELGVMSITGGDITAELTIPSISGRHALYFVFDDERAKDERAFQGRELCQLERFVFTK